MPLPFTTTQPITNRPQKDHNDRKPLWPIGSPTKRLLPVMRDSSAMELPSITFPSTGNFPPGTTFTMSPLWTSSTDTCSSLTHTAQTHTCARTHTAQTHTRARTHTAQTQYGFIWWNILRIVYGHSYKQTVKKSWLRQVWLYEANIKINIT